MARPTRTVYLIKALHWRYNDECTIPFWADLQKAYARREDAERERRRLEREARKDPYSEAPANELQIDEEEVPRWLSRFGVPAPPNAPGQDLPNYHDEAWHASARQQLGEERYDEFAQAFFADEPYYYHVLQTELEP
jgi:hypothetical protein